MSVLYEPINLNKAEAAGWGGVLRARARFWEAAPPSSWEPRRDEAPSRFAFLARWREALLGAEAGPDLERLPPPQVDHRLYVVGDIHGRIDLLDAMLERIAADAGDEAARRGRWLVFLGDYVDRGDHAKAVIARLREIQLGKRLYGLRPIFLMGNHERLLLDALEDPAALPAWLAHGGVQTLWSYGVRPPESDEPAALAARRLDVRAALAEHLDFFTGLRLSFRRGAVFCAHAGVDPDLPLGAQDEQALLWGHPAFLRRGGPDGAVVVHGHRITLSADVGLNRVGVDTGAFATGRLSALRVDPQEGYEILEVGR